MGYHSVRRSILQGSGLRGVLLCTPLALVAGVLLVGAARSPDIEFRVRALDLGANEACAGKSGLFLFENLTGKPPAGGGSK